MQRIRPTTVWLLVALSFVGTAYIAATVRALVAWRLLGGPSVPGAVYHIYAMLGVVCFQIALVIGLDRCSNQQLLSGSPESTRACLRGVRLCAATVVMSVLAGLAPLVWRQYTLLGPETPFWDIFWVNLDPKNKQTPPGMLFAFLIPMPVFLAWGASGRLRRLPSLFRALPDDREGRVLWYLLYVASDPRITDERLSVLEPDEKLVLPGLDCWLTTKRILAFTSIDPPNVESIPRAEVASLTWHARDSGTLACHVRRADGGECMLPSFDVVDDGQHDFVLRRILSAAFESVSSRLPWWLRRGLQDSSSDSKFPLVEKVIESLFSNRATSVNPEARECLAGKLEDGEQPLVSTEKAGSTLVLTTQRVCEIRKKRVRRTFPIAEGSRLDLGRLGFSLRGRGVRTASFDLRSTPALSRIVFLRSLALRPQIGSLDFG